MVFYAQSTSAVISGRWERDRQTETERQRETDRLTDRQTETETGGGGREGK